MCLVNARKRNRIINSCMYINKIFQLVSLILFAGFTLIFQIYNIYSQKKKSCEQSQSFKENVKYTNKLKRINSKNWYAFKVNKL